MTFSQDIPKVRSEIEGEIEPNKDEIVMVLNLAIDAEKNAQARYEKIANMLEESEEKGIFKSLAQEERNHQKILEDEFYHISNKGTIVWE
jgi:rubrerythrin